MPPLTPRFPSRLADPLGSADPLGWHRGRPGASFGDAGAASPRCSPRGMDPAGSPRGPPRLQPRGGRGGCGRSSTAPLRSRWSLRGGWGGAQHPSQTPGSGARGNGSPALLRSAGRVEHGGGEALLLPPRRLRRAARTRDLGLLPGGTRVCAGAAGPAAGVPASSPPEDGPTCLVRSGRLFSRADGLSATMSVGKNANRR